jgi:hypothetical protein
VVFINKNLIDTTAAYTYGLGVSIIHVAYIISMCLIKKVNVEKAADMDLACLKEAEEYESLWNWLLATHIVCFISCLYREIYSVKTDLTSQFMRIVEVFLIPLHLSNILNIASLLALILVREHT